jgi:DNA-binding GntR family transcriptional regulator
VKAAEESLAEIGPINRESVEHRAATALRDLIVSGKLAEGTPLVQRDLAERLGISQTPIRHALSELERLGLAEIGENGRAWVRRLTREDLEELFLARLGLEGLAARLGAVAVGDDELARMDELLQELYRLARRQEIDEYLDGRWEFHSLAYRASGRTRLVNEVERLFLRGSRYHRLVLSSAANFKTSVAAYHDFLIACQDHDPDEAERVIHDSMRWAVEAAGRFLPSELEEG